jgi:hypothetical protein
MTDENEQSIPSRGYERGRICPVTDDDPVGFFIVGLFLLPVMLFGMLAVVCVGALAVGVAYSQACWLLQLIAGKP